VEFGIGLPIVQQVPARAAGWESAADTADLVRVAQTADELGFRWLTCSDHVAIPSTYASSMGTVWYEPIATLAYLGALTRRIRLLSHVLVLPYRHPLLVAKSVATLDRLTEGRVVVGVGVGHLKPEFRALSLPFDERGARTDDALVGLRGALTEARSSHSGAATSWHDMHVDPRPVQQPCPPIWVGGNGARALRRAVTYGDGWIPWEIEPEELTVLLDSVLPGHTGVSRDLEIVAPLAVAPLSGLSTVERRIRAFEDAGATAAHVNFSHGSLAELLEAMTVFARSFL